MSKDNKNPPTIIPTSHDLDSGRTAPPGNIQYLQRGIYTIAYDPASSMSSGTRACNIVDARPFAVRLLYDIFLIAPRLLILHFLCAFWRSLEPALNLHVSALLLALVCNSCSVHHHSLIDYRSRRAYSAINHLGSISAPS